MIRLQFSTAKRLGLSILILLQLLSISIAYYFNRGIVTTLTEITKTHTPMQASVLQINHWLNEANQKFTIYVHSEQGNLRDIERSTLELLSLLGNIEQNLDQWPKSLDKMILAAENFQKTLNIANDGLGSEENTHADISATLSRLLTESDSLMHEITDAIQQNTDDTASWVFAIQNHVIGIETQYSEWSHSKHINLEDVFKLSQQANEELTRLKQLSPSPILKSTIDTLVHTLKNAAAALWEYSEEEKLDPSSSTLQEAEITVIDTWNKARSMLGQFNQDLQNDLSEAQQRTVIEGEKSIWVMISLALATLGVAIAASWIMHHALSRPVQELLAGTRAIARGDLSHRIGFIGADEIGQLGKDFDVMAGQLQTKEEAIYRKAYFDSLTGLPNRQLFYKLVGDALTTNKRRQQKIAVMFIDLDNFKWVNDTLGHSAGDELLKNMAERIVASVRESDSVSYPSYQQENEVSRIGGDEFVVLIRDVVDSSHLAIIAGRILTALTHAMTIQHQDLIISASIGISLSPDDGTDIDQLLKNADKAMYYAKDNGKNTYAYFSEEMNKKAMQRLRLEVDLRKAAEQMQFKVFYQPQLDAESGEIRSLEALLRWQSPKHGLVSPAEFIPVAEDSNLIIPIGNWVIEEVCQQITRWSKQQIKPLSIAINISSIQFNQAGFPEHIHKIVENSGIDPKYLVLELTESVIMKDTEAGIKTLFELRDKGFEISVDDFGTGYSSLSYLKKFPLNELKIDQAFVRDLAEDKNDQAICQAIIAMAHKLDLRVVAEGVETAEQRDFFIENGCNKLQGYLICEPKSAKEFVHLLPKSTLV